MKRRGFVDAPEFKTFLERDVARLKIAVERIGTVPGTDDRGRFMARTASADFLSVPHRQQPTFRGGRSYAGGTQYRVPPRQHGGLVMNDPKNRNPQQSQHDRDQQQRERQQREQQQRQNQQPNQQQPGQKPGQHQQKDE